MTFSIDQIMQRDWIPVATTKKNADGCFELRVPPVNDFVFYAETEEELSSDWLEAFRSHIKAYLAVGKVIPWPVSFRYDVAEGVAETSTGGAWARAVVRQGRVIEVDRGEEVAA